jgi:hypothetical protein
MVRSLLRTLGMSSKPGLCSILAIALAPLAALGCQSEPGLPLVSDDGGGAAGGSADGGRADGGSADWGRADGGRADGAASDAGPHDGGTTLDGPGRKDAVAPDSAFAGDLKPVKDAFADAAGFCKAGDQVLPIGGSYFDGCNTCTCTPAGMACTGRYCPPADAGPATDVAPVCALPAALTFGPTGGMVMYQDSSTLTPPWSYARTRTYLRTNPPDLRCAPPLPACGTAGAAAMSAIIGDLADAEVASAFALPKPVVFGIDMRPVDGTVYSIARGDGGTILVGSPCPSPVMSSCRPIPAGVQRLVDHLRQLERQMLATPECAAFRP